MNEITYSSPTRKDNEIYLEIMEIFEKLDKKLFCKLETYKNPIG